MTSFPNWGHETDGDEVVKSYSQQVAGRIFAVTGPTPNGLGEGTVLALAKGLPAALLLIGRTPAKYAPVVQAVRAIDPSIDVRTYEIDLSSFSSIRAGASRVLADFPKVDVLINNAATNIRTYRRTVDGIEEIFATNYVGPFLLTNLLMPALLRSEAPRVVNLTSLVHREGTGDFSDCNFEKSEYKWWAAYAQSKLGNLLFTRRLATVLGHRGLVSLSVHPGTLWNTNALTLVPAEELQQLKILVTNEWQCKEKTLGQGVATTCVAALDPKLGECNGAYMEDCQVAEPHCPAAKSVDGPEELWNLSEEFVGETFVY
ncbi:NAD(P)-binding protein [Exidia glandulosa HHB12029]|uniref:NAD(P)-binding protein n=1 Tax=Exidia glandulosa HHB12029 TaxID=1314781 RepID=A0A165QMN8_EXIGL|nr:NAD(P)-binding protein [Exidia glandulosa HHB12029]